MARGGGGSPSRRVEKRCGAGRCWPDPILVLHLSSALGQTPVVSEPPSRLHTWRRVQVCRIITTHTSTAVTESSAGDAWTAWDLERGGYNILVLFETLPPRPSRHKCQDICSRGAALFTGCITGSQLTVMPGWGGEGK